MKNDNHRSVVIAIEEPFVPRRHDSDCEKVVVSFKLLCLWCAKIAELANRDQRMVVFPPRSRRHSSVEGLDGIRLIDLLPCHCANYSINFDARVDGFSKRDNRTVERAERNKWTGLLAMGAVALLAACFIVQLREWGMRPLDAVSKCLHRPWIERGLV